MTKRREQYNNDDKKDAVLWSKIPSIIKANLQYPIDLKGHYVVLGKTF